MTYLRLLKEFFRINFSLFAIYRADFVNSLIGSLGWICLSTIGITIITMQTPSVGGWNRFELYLMMGGYSMLTGLFYFFFPRNFNRFTTLVRDGALDGLLLKPVDGQFLATNGQLSLAQIGRFLFGFGLVMYAFGELEYTMTLEAGLSAVVLLVCSVVILYSLWFFASTTAIWLTDVTNIIDVLYEFTGFARYPTDVYKILPPLLFDLLLPLSILVTFPVQAIVGRLSSYLLLVAVFSACGAFVASRAFWKFALRFYTSASS